MKAVSEVKLDPNVRDLVSLLLLLPAKKEVQGGVRQKYQTNDDDALERPGNQCLPLKILHKSIIGIKQPPPPQGQKGKERQKGL